MKNTFLNKVSAERTVLKVVNSYGLGHHQLTGLSGPAIDTWLASIGPEIGDAIRGQLESLSMQCQRLSDRSHETFGEIDEKMVANLLANLSSFEDELSRCRRQ